MSHEMTQHWSHRHHRHDGGHRRRGAGFRMGGGGGGYGQRGKVGRGDVRIAILHLLAESPMHGYQIMQELIERTGGAWQPSPGSIYPTLQLLEDEGLARADEQDGKNVFTLTVEGRTKVEASKEAPPWERFNAENADGVSGLRDAGFQIGAAAMQVARTGSATQVARTREILEEGRRRIYQILADDDLPTN